VQRADDGLSRFLLRSVLALLCGVWLAVFLNPMEKLGLLVNANSFLFLILTLVVTQMLPMRIVRLVAAVLASFGYVAYYYGPIQAGMVGKMHAIFLQEWAQFQALLHGSGLLSDPLQTQLFLFVLCAMYWLIAYASRRTRLWVFYNMLAVIVLGIVDANTPVHPNFAIVAVLLVCTVVLGVIHFGRLHLHMTQNERGPVRFFAPLSGLVVVVMVVGWVFPKQPAAWPDPAKLWNQYSNGNGPGTGIQVIGYQSDNEHLGGSFAMNHDPVLSVITKTPTNLRGEAYDNYTGKGWLPGYGESQTFQSGESFSPYVGQIQHVKSHLVTQEVQVVTNKLSANVVFGAYSIDKVQRVLGVSSENVFRVDKESDTVTGQPLAQNEKYVVQSYEMETPYDYLSTLPPLPAHPDYTEDIMSDVQLPPTLPTRVHDLALKVTLGAKNEYEAAQRIRDYLQTTYTYDTKNVPVPNDQQDYVDQFLFESKRGYCNNFSSAMAVMMRSLDYPTRWVTGFYKGAMDSSYTAADNNRYIYENADAHSWVEVYFPTVGWIPFDPTPNFYSSFAQSDSPTAPGGDNQSPGGKKPIAPPVDAPTSGDPSGSTFSLHWRAIAHVTGWVFGSLALLVLGLGYVFRQRIREKRHSWVWKNPSLVGMMKALQHLVRLLRRYGEIPNQANTLRDLHPVAKSYGIPEEEYVHMIKTAELTWYGGVTPKEEDVVRVRKTWLTWLLGILRR
jgi:transglutaminase-like putative cysteine protease